MKPWLVAVVLAVPPVSAGAQEVIPAPKVTGYVQVRTTVGDDRTTTSLNRARTMVSGALPAKFSYRVMIELQAPVARAASTVSLRDAYIRWAAIEGVAFQAGQFKTPFSREYLASFTVVETPERAFVVDTLAPKRDLGAMAEVNLAGWATASLGAFNGEGQNTPDNRDSTSLWVARATLRPIAQATLAGNLAAVSDDSLTWGVEAQLEHAGFLLRGERIVRERHGGARIADGWYVVGTARVLPWAGLVAREQEFRRPALGDARRYRATTLGADLDLGGGRTRLLVTHEDRRPASGQATRQWIGQLQVRF